MKKSLWIGICLLAVVVEMSSCVNIRKLQYMQGAFDTTKLSSYTIPEPIIQKGDQLSITVYSDNPAASAIYNQSAPPAGSNNPASLGASTVMSGTAVAGAGGYLVDGNGNIQFQSLGNIHAEGLTKLQLTAQLDSSLKTYLTNPYCTVRFLNFKVTLIGDVAHPGVYSIPSERVNVLEAIGLAGDLTITARRDNVLVVREQNGKRQWGRIDLTKPDIFTSPFYQLQQSDVVYVDLTKAKAASSDQTARNVTIIATAISALAIVVSLVRK
jgi:polysaccharide export outer membrane protein